MRKAVEKKKKGRRVTIYIMYLAYLRYGLVLSGHICTLYAHSHPVIKVCAMVSIWQLGKLKFRETVTYPKSQKQGGRVLRFDFLVQIQLLPFHQM